MRRLTPEQENLLTDIDFYDRKLRIYANMDSDAPQELSSMRKKEIQKLVDSVHVNRKGEPLKIRFRADKKQWYTVNPLNPDTNIGSQDLDALYKKLFRIYFIENPKRKALLELQESTVEELFEPAIKDHAKRKNLVSRTLKHYRYIHRRYLVNDRRGKRFSEIKIREVTRDDVSEFFYSFSGELTKNDRGNLKTVIDLIFRYAYEKKIIDVNPVESFHIGDVKTKASKDTYDDVYTDEDRERILAVTDESDNVYDMGISLLFSLCARIGELEALEVTDYRRDEKSLRIDKMIAKRGSREDPGSKEHKITVYHTKTGRDSGTRTVRLPERAVKIVEKAIGDRTEGYLLQNRAGGHLHEGPFRERLKKVCEKAGVTYRKPHKIRSWAASKMADEGVDMMTMMAIGGWSDKGTVLGYIRHSSVKKKEDQICEKIFG